MQDRSLDLALDKLTGLPSRVLFEDRVERAIAQASRSGEQFALLHLRLAQPPVLRTNLDSEIHSGFLQAFADRIRRFIRRSDTFARIDGSEFAILQRNVHNSLGVTTLVEKVLDALEVPFTVAGMSIDGAASIGISLFRPGVSAGELIDQAESAIDSVTKDGASEAFRFHDRTLDHKMHYLASLKADLEEGLERGEFVLEYQPQVDISGRSTVATEALVRWRHPTHGLLWPTDFISLSEESGFIRRLGLWVLEQACRQRLAWNEAGVPRMPIAVNVSGVQLGDPSFASSVLEVLRTTGLEGNQLDLEVTETVLLESAEALHSGFHRLHDAGVRFSIDDFGTGHSSLRYLQVLPVDKLKIAMEFVSGLPGDRDSAAIVEALVALGHKLGLRVLAEGVETAEQVSFLEDCGCDQMQGFHFARPMAPESIVKRLADSL